MQIRESSECSLTIHIETNTVFTAVVQGSERGCVGCRCVSGMPAARGRVLLEKLIVAQLLKKLRVIYGTRRFITVFIAVHFIV
jgi:hypothetical protein